jgi:hypothetical protein
MLTARKYRNRASKLVILSIGSRLNPIGSAWARHFAVTGAVRIGDRPIPLKAEPIEET